MIRLVAGDLKLKSKQNTSDSKATSFSIGGGFSTNGGGKSGNGNISYSKSVSDRDWVDNQASIIGTNSIIINTGNNTNIIGSVIANSTNRRSGESAVDKGNLIAGTGRRNNDKTKLDGLNRSLQNKKTINLSEYFFDKNNNLARLLKTYELKDIVYEIVGSLWLLSWFIANPAKYNKTAENLKDVKKFTESKIFKNPVHQILNDARSFSECQKNDIGEVQAQKSKLNNN